MRRRTWTRISACAAILTIVAAACGGDDDDSSSAATTAPTTAGPRARVVGDGFDERRDDHDDRPIDRRFGRRRHQQHRSEGRRGDERQRLPRRLKQLYPEAIKYTEPVPTDISGNTTQGVTDTTITIGSVMGMTTSQGVAPFPGECEAMMARIELENSKGGVKAGDGKTRTFVFAGDKDDQGRVCQDDKLDRDTNRQKIQDMVEGDKVFALLPVTSNGFYAGDYLTDKHIPYLGLGFQPDYCGSDREFAFAVGGAISCDPLGDKTFVSSTVAAPLWTATGLDPKAQKVAIAGAADPSSTTGIKIVQLGYEATGADVVTVDNSLPPAGSPLPTDFTPFVTSLLKNDPTVVSLVISYDQVEPMAKGLRDAGYKGVIQQFVYEDERLAFVPNNYPGIDGSYVGNPGVGSPVGDTQGLSDIRAALDAAGFKSQTITTSVLDGWGEADMLIQMIENTPGPLTTENLVNTANAGWDYQGYGQAVCPTTWPLQHISGSPCIHVVQLDLTGAHGATNSVGANGGKGGLLSKVTEQYSDLFIADKPK